jgi:hypothetical protein
MNSLGGVWRLYGKQAVVNGKYKGVILRISSTLTSS